MPLGKLNSMLKDWWMSGLIGLQFAWIFLGSFVFSTFYDSSLICCDLVLNDLTNENYGQWKRYQRHIANVSITPAIIISALQIELQWSCCKFLLVTQVKTLWKKKNAKGCFGSYVVALRIRSHMTQLDTRRWWCRVTSRVRHEALLQVKTSHRYLYAF